MNKDTKLDNLDGLLPITYSDILNEEAPFDINFETDTQDFLDLDGIISQTASSLPFTVLDDTNSSLDPIDIIETKVISEDSTDYLVFLNSLYKYLSSTYSSLTSKMKSSKKKPILPFSETDLSFFEMNQLDIYIEIWNDLIKQNSSLPDVEELLQFFLTKFEDLGWSINLVKDKFSYIFREHYKQVLNNILSYKDLDNTSTTFLYDTSDFSKIKNTLKEVSFLIDFPNFCNDILIRDLNIDLTLNLYQRGLTSFTHPFTSKPLETILDMQNTAKELLRSDYVISFMKETLNIDCTSSSYGEIIRLLCITNYTSYKDIIASWEENPDIVKNIDIIWEYLFHKKNEGDFFAFILCLLILIILYGFHGRNINNTEQLQHFYLMFIQYIWKLDTDFSFQNISIITSLFTENEKLYTICSKGQKYPINHDFYVITGFSSKIFVAPLCVNCSCSDKQCRGKLFPLSFFIDNLNSLLLGKNLNYVNNLKFKLEFGYKSLYQLGFDIEIEESKNFTPKLSQTELDKFIQFENLISEFKFKDTTFEPKYINFAYEGPIHINHPEFIIDEDCSLRISGITLANDYHKILKLLIDDTVIVEGVWLLSANELQLFFYMSGVSTEVTLNLPLSNLTTIEEDTDSLISNSTEELSLDKILNINLDYIPNFDSEKIAKSLCNFTGLPYHILLNEAETLIISEYMSLLKLHDVEILLCRYIAKTYISLIKSEEFNNDIFNFNMLKNLLTLIQGDKNILSDYSSASDISLEDKSSLISFLEEPISLNNILSYLNSIDISILAFNLSFSEKNISDTDLKLYRACLYIPPIGNILLTLQNQIVIFKNLVYLNEDLDSLVMGNSYILKNYKNALSSTEITGFTNGICKRFKNCNAEVLLQNVRKLLSITHTDNYILLKYYILNKKFFEIINTLLLLEDLDLVSNILSTLNCNLDTRFFLNINNAETFYTTLPSLSIDIIYDLYNRELFNYIYKGILCEVYSKGYINQIVCFDLLLCLLDNLLYLNDFKPAVRDYTDDFFTLFGSLYLTYCKAGDETIMNSFEDRKKVFLKYTNEFPEIASPYFQSLPLKDYLYVMDGGDLVD